jgi:HPt (histidine-containing phosphotransfer) domain-containing protein
MEIEDQLTVLDKASALERAGGDLELLQEVARLFLDEYPKMLAEIRQAIHAGDARTLERAAHNLKGSVGNFGARAAHDAAYRLEVLARMGEMARVSEAYGSLESELSRLRPGLNELAEEQ